ncbi:terpene synthase family protein [Chitinophaga japonensis]|uniref:Terpene synthase n=1 Tax=Chitinophaga japonensis TaxID=104662 RepID=A0A562T706_CHIJA|nr:hypothetical protein [Chitinophaga japonensis]TWI89315.1 hypothetical protein LX66_3411 [Chitinophaga japonensis]
MKTLPFPRISYPFTYGMNPHTAAVDVYTINWAVKYDLIENEAMLARYRQMQLNALVGRLYYSAGFQALRLLADYNFLFFIMDDRCDAVPRGQKKVYWEGNTARLTAVMDQHKRVFRGEGHPFEVAFSDAWERTQHAADAEWRSWFAATIREYFHACIWEAGNLDAGTPPTLEKYLAMRPYIAAAPFNVCAITYAENIRLPYEVYRHPVVRQLMHLPARIVCWVNDLFSLRKEQQAGDMHNLVLVLQQERGLSMEAAMEAAACIHAEDMAQYLRLEQQLPVLDKATGKELARYLTYLRAMISGNLEWSTVDTNRYYC